MMVLPYVPDETSQGGEYRDDQRGKGHPKRPPSQLTIKSPLTMFSVPALKLGCCLK